MNFESRNDIDAYLAEEPYVVEGVWDKIVIEPMNVVILDGKIAGK